MNASLRRVFRVVRRVAAVALSAVAVIGAVRLIAPATAGPTGEPPGVRRQLTFLRQAIDGGAADQAQQAFPEGYFFLHALYGLTWVELAQRTLAERAGDRDSATHATRATALREARWALDRLDSPAGRAPFSPDLTPRYGVFYAGWTSWLRGGVLSLQPAGERDPAQVRRFTDDTAAIAAAFDASGTPFLAAYPGQSWPVDSTVAVAALRLYDSLFPPRFAGTVSRWLALVRGHLDPGTGLMPHQSDVDTGAPIAPARASSQSVIQRFLPEIDPAFARQQYLIFRDRFVVRPLGLGPAVREYPSGVDGGGDVDSGPLVLGVSLSATVVTLGAAQVEGDTALAGALANYGELVGVPVDTPWTKRYGFGLLPVGDAFLAWSKTAHPWIAPAPAPPPAAISWWWRLPLLCLLLLVGLAPWARPALRIARALRARRRPLPLPQPSTVEPYPVARTGILSVRLTSEDQ